MKSKSAASSSPIDLKTPKPSDHVLVEHLNNLGPVSKKMLAEIDVYTAGDIRKLGPDLIYHILKGKGTIVSLNMVYALAAALEGIHWTKLPPKEKLRLTVACKGDSKS